MRIALAFRAFFAALAGKRLPVGVLPMELVPALPSASADPHATKAIAEESGASDADAQTAEAEPDPASSDAERQALAEAVAAQMLGLFQSEGRLLDFLAEDIADYPDADVGQVVREIHRGCKKALEDHFSLEPVRSEPEEGSVTIGAGFDPGEVRLVGNVVGNPPFSGTLKHAGYRATQVRLPRIRSGPSALVVVPAEVEI